MQLLPEGTGSPKKLRLVFRTPLATGGWVNFRGGLHIPRQTNSALAADRSIGGEYKANTHKGQILVGHEG
jgi:hypothetical protein